MDIFKTINREIREFETHFYLEDVNLAVDIYNNSICIQDLTNAGKPGKECFSVSCMPKGFANSQHEVIQHFEVKFESEFFKTWFDKLVDGVEIKEEYSFHDFENDNSRFQVSKKKAAKVFSPFAKFNRLKVAPKKWTKRSFVNALMNGQFDQVTDGDNEVFAVKAVEDIICHYDWDFYEIVQDNGDIGVRASCYVDSYFFTFKPEAYEKIFEYVSERNIRFEREREIREKKEFESINYTRKSGAFSATLKYDSRINKLVLTSKNEVIGTYSMNLKSEAHTKIGEMKEQAFKEQLSKFEVISLTEAKEEVKLYSSEKSSDLEDHYQWLNEYDSEKYSYKVSESMIVSEDNFKFICDNLWNFPIHEYSKLGFKSCLLDKDDLWPEIENYEDLTEEQKEYYQKHKVLCVTEVVKQGSTERIFLSSLGANYARFAGTLNSKPVEII